jgi:hypothetical protein
VLNESSLQGVLGSAPTSEEPFNPTEIPLTETSNAFYQVQIDETAQSRNELVSQFSSVPSEEPTVVVQQPPYQGTPEQERERTMLSSVAAAAGLEDEGIATIIAPSLIPDLSADLDFLSNHAEITDLGPTVGEFLDGPSPEPVLLPHVANSVDSSLVNVDAVEVRPQETEEAGTQTTPQANDLTHGSLPTDLVGTPSFQDLNRAEEELEYVVSEPGSPDPPKHHCEVEISSHQESDLGQLLEYVVEEPVTESNHSEVELLHQVYSTS